MSDIFDRYPTLRGKPREMAMMCALLRDRKLHDDALALGRAALAAAPDNLAVRAEVSIALSRTVADFHGPMMLDRARNAAYARVTFMTFPDPIETAAGDTIAVTQRHRGLLVTAEAVKQAGG